MTTPLGLPGVTVQFENRVAAFGTIAGAGKLALVLKDPAAETDPLVLDFTNRADALAAKTWSPATQKALSLAFDGAPRAVALVVLPEASAFTAGYALLEQLRFDVCTVVGLTAEDAAAFVTWAKAAYDDKGIKALFVTAGAVSPAHPALVWVDASEVTTLDAAGNPVAMADAPYGLLPLIGGILAGLQLWESATYYPLPMINSCARMSKSEADAAIAAGKLILYDDGEKVKIARGVTSYADVTSAYSAEWRKIKVVRIINQIETDITRAIEDSYIGKVPNTVVQKHLVISAILGYLQGLEGLEVLQAGTSTVALDIERTRTYLKTIMDTATVDAMSDEDVAEESTGDKLFLLATIRPADAIEDIYITVSL